MRIGIALSAGDGERPLETLSDQARVCEEAGVELLWLQQGAVPEPLLSAAALAARTSSVRLAACVRAGGHPLAIAEAAAVADCCSAGRLVLALADEEGDEELLAETADALLAATAARPFAHAGRRWRIPAGLPENDGHSRLIALTPATVQIELPVWLCGQGAAEVARPRCLCSVSAEQSSPAGAAAEWSITERTLGLAAARLPRPALRPLTVDGGGGFDEDALVERLREEQRGWGLDVAILRPSGELDGRAWRALVGRVASRVRPRLVQDELPSGLEDHWRSRD